MVHNPKHSKMIMLWCLESVLGLAFDLAGRVGDKLNEKYLRDHIEESNFNVSGRQISQMMSDLKRRNYIEISDGDSVKLTDKAKIKIIDRLCRANSVDGRYRLVSFDIPETKRSNRDNFRRAIKRMGFKQIQKSLWASNRNVGELVDVAAAEYRVSEYVAYFVAEKSNIDKHISNIFLEKEKSKE